MRSRLLLLLLCFIGGATTACGPECDRDKPFGTIGSCPVDYTNTGREYAYCHDDGSCDPGLTCVGLQCLSCGHVAGDGDDGPEPCCGSSNSSGGYCLEGSCAFSSSSEWYTCQGCGTLGGACCPNNYCSEGTCQPDGTCQDSGTTQTSCGGAITYTVWGIDATCAAYPFTFTAADDASALDCFVNGLKTQYSLTWGLPSQDPYATAPTEFAVCPQGCSTFGTSGQTVYLYAFDPSQLAVCEYNKDSTCTSWDTNACP